MHPDLESLADPARWPGPKPIWRPRPPRSMSMLIEPLEPSTPIAAFNGGLFAHSGLSIAMGNASHEVQRAAHRVTLSNVDEGFAAQVERFILP